MTIKINDYILVIKIIIARGILGRKKIFNIKNNLLLLYGGKYEALFLERKIILASASPRRVELLGRLALPFDVIPADIEESRRVA